jgi:hypothetical protein
LRFQHRRCLGRSFGGGFEISLGLIERGSATRIVECLRADRRVITFDSASLQRDRFVGQNRRLLGVGGEAFVILRDCFGELLNRLIGIIRFAGDVGGGECFVAGFESARDDFVGFRDLFIRRLDFGVLLHHLFALRFVGGAFRA